MKKWNAKHVLRRVELLKQASDNYPIDLYPAQTKVGQILDIENKNENTIEYFTPLLKSIVPFKKSTDSLKR